MNNPNGIEAKETILIVDDQPNNLKVISSVLNEKYSLNIANSGARALKILEKIQPDLILLDIMMPDMDGYEVCQIIKKNDKLKDIPIIFLTAKTDTEDIVKGFDLGAVDYILKPFNIKEVSIRIKNHLNLSNAKKTIARQNDELEEHVSKLEIANEAVKNYAVNLKHSNKELLESEGKLKLSNGKLKIAVDEKDKFFSIIAHDLRGPFAGVIGVIDMLTDDTFELEDNDKNELIGALKSSVNTLYQLLENLLQWSRMQRGHVQFAPSQITVSQIANSCVDLLKQSSTNKEISMNSVIDSEKSAFIDANMIQTVVRNLLSNALKFTPRGGKIELSIRDYDDKFYAITVKDSGVGIPEKTLKILFDLGSKVSTPGTEDESSTGLGLSICKDMVEKHGGKIWAESIENEGSSFIFTVPKEEI